MNGANLPTIRNSVSPQQAAKAEACLVAAKKTDEQPREPIALRIAVGIGSWLTSLFLLGFLFAAFEPDEIGAAILGAVLLSMAIAVHHLAKNKPIFIEQSILASVGAAHLLILVGGSEAISHRYDAMTIAMTQTALCTVGIFAYRQSIYRISSLLLAVFLWTHAALDAKAPELYQLLLIIQCIIFAILTLWRAKNTSYITALAISLFGSIFFLDWLQSDLWRQPMQASLWPANLCMTVLLGLITCQILPISRQHSFRAFGAMGILALLAFGSSPGILLGVALTVYGHGFHHQFIKSLGIAGLFASIGFYYYSLQTSLLMKSGTLLLSGIICLLIAAYAYRNLNPRKYEDSQ